MGAFKKSELLTIGFMMFSVFFGAGNLIFPPALGQAAGDHSVLAMIGFLMTGVGLPLLGISAIALQGGRYIELMRRRLPRLYVGALLAVLYLTIGPLFAIPRTGAVSFEIGIRPFLSQDSIELGEGIYTFLFFAATYYLAINPNKLIDRVGKMLTPLLLVGLAVLFVVAFLHPLGPIGPATGSYVASPFAQGFQDGYQTMDLLATIAIGTLVVNAVRMRGVTEDKVIGQVCLAAGLITVTLMAIVYGSLAYLGATSISVLGHSANGGQLLAAAVDIFFGKAGGGLLALIIMLACLTTSCGMASGTAWYFNKVLNKRVSYERLLLLFVVFSFFVSNVGLTQIIALAVPFLVAIYPLVIVFVLVSLFDGKIGGRGKTYRFPMYVTLVFSLLDGLNAAGIPTPLVNSFLSQYVPFYSVMLGWLVPAVLAAFLGYGYSAWRGAR